MALWRVLWARNRSWDETSNRDASQSELATTKMSASSSEADVEFKIPSRGKGGKASLVAGQQPGDKDESAMDVTRPDETLPENASNSMDSDLATAPSTSNVTEEQASDTASSDSSGCDRFYTDPQTNCRYEWCSKAKMWLLCDGEGAAGTASKTANPYETEHYKWCTKTQQWIAKAQATETEYYKWDTAKGEWVPKAREESAIEVDAEGRRTYTDPDGAVYLWDKQKNAWFPKIDDEFLARYQMNYGFIDNTSADQKAKDQQLKRQAELKALELERLTAEAKSEQNDAAAMDGATATMTRKKTAFQPPKWFDMDPAHNTKVYVSNLPLDITLEEFAEVMGKCGMIMRDPQTQKYKLKLYAEPDGQLKGDGLCDYIKVESVDLALKILDEYDLRGHKMRVERAKFEMRGEYNPALKPKRKKKDKEKFAKLKEKLFDWRPGRMRGERGKNEKVVIIKNLFEPSVFEQNVELILEYHDDLREECAKCGTVRKVVIYDRHPEGVAQVNMSTHAEADLVIQMMQGRFFGKRQLCAEHWDGKTKYKIVESKVEAQKRLSDWDNFLESGGEERHAKMDAVIVETDVALQIEAALETEIMPEAGTALETNATPEAERTSETDVGISEAETSKVDAAPEAETSEMDTIPETEITLQTNAMPEADITLDTEPMPEGETRPETEIALDVKPISERETMLETDAILATEITLDTKQIPEAETTPETDPIIEAVVDTKPIPERETDAISEAEITLDTKAIPEGETMPEAEPMPEAKTIPRTETVTESEVVPEEDPSPVTQIARETEMSPDTEVILEAEAALTKNVTFGEDTAAQAEISAAEAASKVDLTEPSKVPSEATVTTETTSKTLAERQMKILLLENEL